MFKVLHLLSFAAFAQVAASQIHVRVIDLANVRAADLARAEKEVSRIFAKEQLEVEWRPDILQTDRPPQTDFSIGNSSPAGCKTVSYDRDLQVLLLPRSPVGVPATVLGFSLPCATFGAKVVIYVDRCEGVTDRMPITFSKVLAHAMAHELGHVLLQSAGHSRSGLMMASWDKAAWLRAATGAVRMEPGDARRIRINLSRVETLLANGKPLDPLP